MRTGKPRGQTVHDLVESVQVTAWVMNSTHHTQSTRCRKICENMALSKAWKELAPSGCQGWARGLTRAPEALGVDCIKHWEEETNSWVSGLRFCCRRGFTVVGWGRQLAKTLAGMWRWSSATTAALALHSSVTMFRGRTQPPKPQQRAIQYRLNEGPTRNGGVWKSCPWASGRGFRASPPEPAKLSGQTLEAQDVEPQSSEKETTASRLKNESPADSDFRLNIWKAF